MHLAPLIALATLSRWVVLPIGAYAFLRALAGATIARPVRSALVAGTAIVAAGLLATALVAAKDPPPYDFLCFWLYGHAAIAHADVYDPAVFLNATLPPPPPPPEFAREILAVAFPYPPPTLLLFAPLGLSHRYELASAVWSASVLAALALAVAVLARSARTPLASPRALALPLAAIVFALPMTADTIVAEQTHTLALAALACAFAWRRGAAGGIAAAVAAIAKPLLLVVPLWFALRRRASPFAASLVTLAVATLAATPFASLAAYLRANPASRQPASLFVESDTASLSAVLLRLRHESGTLATLERDPLFLVLAGVIGIATLALALRASADDEDLALGALVAGALLVYPANTTIYALALVPGWIALARRAAATARSRTPSLALAGAALSLAVPLADRASGDGIFLLTAATWAAFATTIVRRGGADAAARAATAASA